MDAEQCAVAIIRVVVERRRVDSSQRRSTRQTYSGTLSLPSTTCGRSLYGIRGATRVSGKRLEARSVCDVYMWSRISASARYTPGAPRSATTGSPPIPECTPLASAIADTFWILDRRTIPKTMRSCSHAIECPTRPLAHSIHHGSCQCSPSVSLKAMTLHCSFTMSVTLTIVVKSS